MPPRICCLDLDTFFASVERLFDPSLVGKALVVGGERWGRGVVVSASYEARAFGIRSGMSIREASEKAPREAVFVAGHHEAYGDYSRRAREIVERYSPDVVAASIDEHYLDFTGCERLYRKASDVDDDAAIERVVNEITAAIQHELGLPSSAGIATSKSTAKVASNLAKPAGVIMVRAGTEAAFLAGLAVRKLPGIGPVAEQKLAARGITTLAELVAAPEAVLRPIFGAYTTSIRRAARGDGGNEIGRERPAFREHDPFGGAVGSISNARTFIETSEEATRAVLSGLCERVGSRARRRGVLAGRVTLQLRYADFVTLTRSRVVTPTNTDVELYRLALELYRETRAGTLAVRLLGVALSKLELDRMQLSLFTHHEQRSGAVDKVRDRFGFDAVHLATTLAARRRGK